MSRSELLERYRELPLPTTSEESWRFTDLRGFDPESFVRNGQARGQTPDMAEATMLEIDVAGLATVDEDGIEIERAPEGITFEPLDEHHPRLHELVGADEKFAAHNAALWRHGLLVHVPKGVRVDRPLYVRLANAVDGGSLFWRLLVDVEEGADVTLIEEYVSASSDLPGYSNAAVELFVGQGAKLEYVSLQNLSRETWHFASHHARVERDAELDWVAGGFGSKKGRSASRTTSPARRDLARHGRVLRRRGAAPRLRHLPGAHRAHTTSDFAFKGRSAIARARCGAG